MSKRAAILLMCAVLAATPAAAAKKKLDLKDKKDKMSYAIGLNAGMNLMGALAQQEIDVDMELVLTGLEDAIKNEKPRLEEPELRELIGELQQTLQTRRQAAIEKVKEQAEKNEKDGKAFLAANKKKKGVKTLDSGLQYRIITEGKGKKPQATDTVTVNYKGKLIDGTEFDSSYKRGEPATFPVSGVIKGWTEALQLMKEGSKWELFIPSDLAYGPQGTPGGPIGPNSVLIFEVELLEIKK